MNLSNETSASCEVSRYIGRTTLDFETETVMKYLTIGFILLLFPFAVSLNSLLLVLIGKFKALHQTTFYLALQIVIIDLGITLFVTPLTVINGIAGQWILGPAFCVITAVIISIFRHSRNNLMFVFVADRFCSVYFPFRYFKHRKKIIIPILIVAYLVALPFACLQHILDCTQFSRVTWYCVGGGGCSNPGQCDIVSSISITLPQFWGSYIPLIMYTMLFIKAKRIRRHVASNDVSEERIRINKRERKANLTFFFLFLSLFGVTFLPFVFFIVGRNTLIALGIRPAPAYVIVTTILRTSYNLLPTIDAIAIMRNPDVRIALSLLKKKLRISKEGSSRRNTSIQVEVSNSLALEHTANGHVE